MRYKIIGLFVCMLMIVPALPVVSAVNDQNATPTFSGTINIKIVAKVFEVDDPYNLLGGAIQVNDTLTGKYNYDSGTPDENLNPDVGTYRYTSSSFGIEVNAGGFDFKTNPSDVDFVIQIFNNYYSQDGYIVISINNLQLSNGLLVDEISWSLVNTNDLTVITNDALPTTAPDLVDWTEINTLRLMGKHPSEPFKIYSLKAHVTKATKEKATDIHGAGSDWNAPSMTIPCSYPLPFMQFWNKFFQRFPNLFPILRHLIGY